MDIIVGQQSGGIWRISHVGRDVRELGFICCISISSCVGEKLLVDSNLYDVNKGRLRTNSWTSPID